MVFPSTRSGGGHQPRMRILMGIGTTQGQLPIDGTVLYCPAGLLKHRSSGRSVGNSPRMGQFSQASKTHTHTHTHTSTPTPTVAHPRPRPRKHERLYARPCMHEHASAHTYARTCAHIHIHKLCVLCATFFCQRIPAF